MNERIEVNPKIMAGKPVIKGTRIPVDLIVRQLAIGMKRKEILEDYPFLKEEDIDAALQYSADVVSGEELFSFNEKAKKHAKVSD
mgnify:CR=1 FL=1